MRKKGFTLIELLAVIVILAVIALIAVPIVLNIIEKANKGAAKTSALNYMNAVETYNVASLLNNSKENKLEPNVKYNCTESTITTVGTETKNYLPVNELVEIKGYIPTGSKDYIKLGSNKQVEEAQLTVNGYLITVEDKKIATIVKGAKVKVESIGLNYTEQTMEKGSDFQLKATFTPKDTSDQRVTYASSNESVVKVSENGIVTAVNNGTAKIIVTSKDDTSKKAECNITVITSATGVSIEPTSKEINIGGTVQLTGTIQPGDVTTNALEWTSSNESIAHVDGNGLVTGMGVGSATITAKTVNGKTATSTIIVKEVEASSVSLNKTSATLAVNGTVQLTATINPSNTTNKTLTWTSSNTSVATVSSNGLVTAKAAGTATITVKTSNNKSATATITVGGPTKVAAQAGDTHKGIVYLDPTDLSKECTATNSVSTTNTKSGCMKWYIYNDSGSNYKMILDHNAIARVKWNTSNSNVAYGSSEAKAAMDATLTNWKVTPNFITTSEINAITGKTGFDSTSTGSWYYFDSKTTTQTANASTKSKYDWLYNNTNGCANYGCTVEDNNNNYELYGDSSNKSYTYGYWTRDTVGSAGAGSSVWSVYRCGYLDYYYAIYGVRPVITISKSQIS